MAGYSLLRMKRKDLEETNDDFLHFSLSSPATKIRRLDVEFPPVMEEEPVFPPACGVYSSGGGFSGNVGGPVIEELPVNEERAIVLFNPISSPLVQTPSNFSVSVSSDLISGIKNQGIWSNQFIIPPMKKLTEEDEEDDDDDDGAAGGVVSECMAVVPWVPPNQLQYPTNGNESCGESMEDEVTAMEIEEEEEEKNPSLKMEQHRNLNGNVVSEGLLHHQWQQQQQQHCMMIQQQQFPPSMSSSTPIVWYK